jgi:hypothetical protein
VLALLVAVLFYEKTQPQGELPVPTPLRQESCPNQVLIIWITLIRMWSFLEVGYTVLAIISVSAHIYEPWEWPPLFGYWKDAYTVRQMWGKVWHQMLRRIITDINDKLYKDILKLQKGSFLSKYLQLFTAFFVSATAHVLGSLVLMGSEGSEYFFFVSQAVVILVEDHILSLGRKIGLEFNLFWRLVGYLWVFCWFTYSFRPYAECAIALGAWVA